MDTDALSSLLSDPEALSNLMQTASSMFGQPQSEPNAKPSTPDPAAELTGKLLPMLTTIAQSSHCDSDSDRIRLLTAIKPFISQKSCGEIDHAVRLLGMARMARAAMTQINLREL
ncbi:MAG: hypothetical protein ACI3XY_05660 [Butyricicoccaceae bacterium]